MLRFETESGSVYEVDILERRVRRLTGLNAPTPRVGKDGEWKTFTLVSSITPGAPVLFVWRFDEGPDQTSQWARSTVTSRVQVVTAVENAN